MYFWNYRLRKTWLHKILKSNISEDPLRSNMINLPKHCRNIHDSTFIRFTDQYKCN